MKKAILATVVILVLAACGTTKIERQATRTFKGEWTLNNITYPGSSGFVDVILFEDSPTNCFRNSTWKFVPNNNKGVYTIYGNKCSEGLRNFVWSVQEIDANTGLYDFLLKPVAEGENARKTSKGFRLSLKRLTDTDMVWEQTVSFEGKPFTIRFNFSKSI